MSSLPDTPGTLGPRKSCESSCRISTPRPGQLRTRRRRPR